MHTITVYRENWEPKFLVWELDESRKDDFSDLSVTQVDDKDFQKMMDINDREYWKKRVNEILNLKI